MSEWFLFTSDPWIKFIFQRPENAWFYLKYLEWMPAMRPHAPRDFVFSVLRFHLYYCTVLTENQNVADKEEVAFCIFNF